QVIKLNDVDVVTFDDTFGVRNLVLTSGNYQIGKTTLWEVDDTPWTMVIGPETEEITDASKVAETTSYVTFTKSALNEGDQDTQYIKIPLSESPSTGNYSFCIRAFGGTQLNEPINIKVYLLTEDSSNSKLICTLNVNQTESLSS